MGKNKVKTTFVEFYDKYLEDIKAQVGAGKSIALYHKYSAARSHFVNFLHAKYGRKDLMPGELTHLIIHDFEIYLKTVVSLKSNSATKTLKILQDRGHLCPEVRCDDARPFLEPPLSPGTGGSGFSYG